VTQYANVKLAEGAYVAYIHEYLVNTAVTLQYHIRKRPIKEDGFKVRSGS